MARRKKIEIDALKIEKYAAEGKSIGYWNEKVIFVSGAIPGDVVKVLLLKNKNNWAEAKILQLLEKSSLRQDAFCAHFGICGGCKWQMLPYQKQVAYKSQQMEEQIAHLGQMAVEEQLNIIACDEDRLYRNKLEFTFSNKKYLSTEEMQSEVSAFQNVLGFHAPGVFDKIIDIDHCYLQKEPTNAIKNFIRHFCIENNYSFYDIKNHTGLLRNVMIRINKKGALMLNIIFAEHDEKKINALCNALQKEFSEIVSIYYTINSKLNDSIYDLHCNLFYGEKYLLETLNNLQFAIHPKSFFQTNSKQAEKLYNVVKSFAGSGNILYDLYCGTGSIGLYLHQEFKKIIGVETVDEAVEDAKLNAQLNNITSAQFFSGDVIKVCDNAFFEQHGNADVIILDPPRAGLHPKLIDKLLEIACKRLVYVSCNPATQIRDIKLLNEKYKILKSQAVDMFPQTHHIENVMLLELKND